MQPQKRRTPAAAQLRAGARAAGPAVLLRRQLRQRRLPLRRAAAARPAGRSSPARPVETERPPPLPPTRSTMGEWDRLTSDFVQGECFDFLRPHGFAARRPSAGRRSSTRTASTTCAGCDPLTAVARARARPIYEAFDYEPGVTEADSPIDHALDAGPRRLPGLRPHHDRHLPRLGHAGALRLRLSVHRPRRGHDRSDPRRHPRLGRGLPAVAALGRASIRPTTSWPASATSRWPSAATTPTCRPRAGSSRARPRASWRSASRCATPPPRRPSRSSCAWPSPGLRRRPPPRRSAARSATSTTTSNSSSSKRPASVHHRRRRRGQSLRPAPPSAIVRP